MVALLQFAGLIIIGIFLLAGGNLSSHGGVYEFIGYLSIGFGVFASSLLFYLASRINVSSVRIEGKEGSIIYRNVNMVVDREVRKLKVKRLGVKVE